jgi:hypothetical protein
MSYITKEDILRICPEGENLILNKRKDKTSKNIFLALKKKKMMIL